MQHGQLILKNRYLLHQFLALNSQFLVHGNILDNDISKVISSRIELAVATEDVLFGKLLEGYEARVGGDCQFLRLGPKLAAPGPIIHGVQLSKKAQIAGIEANLLVGARHSEVFARAVEADRERIARYVPFAEFLSSLALTVVVVESLVPASNEQIRILVLRCNRRPLHTPNRSRQLHLVLNQLKTTFSSRFLCLNERVPLIDPKANVCPSADHPEEIIFSLNFSLGISFFPGMKSAKSAAPPLKSS